MHANDEKMPEKIIFLTTDMSVKGGTPRIIADIVNALSGEYHIMILALEGTKSAYALNEDVKAVSLEGKVKFKSRFLNTLLSFSKMLKMAMVIRRERPQTVISLHPRANLNNVLAKKLFGLSYRCIIYELNFTPIQYGESLSGKLMRLLIRALYRHSDLALANAGELADEMGRNYSIPCKKLRVIHNPCDIEKIAAMSKEAVEISWFNEGIPVILTVGRLIKQKNHAMLLRAMRRVSEKVQVRLVILGEGPLKEELIRTAANLGVDREVLLPGWRDNPFKYMSRAKVFVLSSDYEGLPNVLIEALACGVPVISTDCPSGPEEILCGGKYGIVVPVGDEEAMAEGMIRLLEDGNLRMELAMRGKERVRDFEIARIVKKYKELFV